MKVKVYVVEAPLDDDPTGPLKIDSVHTTIDTAKATDPEAVWAWNREENYRSNVNPATPRRYITEHVLVQS